MRARDRIGSKIKEIFRCHSGSPTSHELDKVLVEMSNIRAQRIPEVQDWRRVVRAVVHGATDFEQKAEDFSDLNSLLDEHIRTK